jgi:hypothetical protein
MHMVTQSTHSGMGLRYVAARNRHAQAGVVVAIGVSQAGLAFMLAQPISNSPTSYIPYVEGETAAFLCLTYNMMSQHITACATRYICTTCMGCNLHIGLVQCPTQSAVCMHMHMHVSTFPPSVPLWVTAQTSAAARNAVPQQSTHMHKLVGLLSVAAARPALARMHDSTDKQQPHKQSSLVTADVAHQQ